MKLVMSKGLVVGIVIMLSIVVFANSFFYLCADNDGDLARDSSERPARVNGLVAQWKFDEGTGSTAYDSSGNGNDGAVNNAEWTLGVSGAALEFDGVDDYINVSDDPSISGLSKITVSVWLKVGTIDNRGKIIGKGDNIGFDRSKYEYEITQLTDNTIRFDISDGTTHAEAISSTTVTLDVWCHVVGTYDGSTTKIYVNGKYEDSSSAVTGNINNDLGPLQIGRENDGGSGNDFFHGTIDEVIIYNRALTAEEIGVIYRTQVPPMAEFRFNEGRGAIVHDSSLYGNHGTINGAIWAEGVSGKALEFDGVNDYFKCTGDESLMIRSDLTIAFWLNVNDLTATQRDIYHFAGPTGSGIDNALYELGTNPDGSLTLHHEYDAGLNEFHTTQTGLISENTWHHIVITRDDTAKKYTVYKNGNSIEIWSYTFSANGGSNGNLYLGSNVQTTANFNGIIDEVAIYNWVLTPKEISARYNATAPPIVEYRLNKGIGDLAFDTSGHEIHGTINGGTWTNEGVSGSALEIDGVDDYIALSTPSLSTFTISGWLKPNGEQNTYARFFMSKSNSFDVAIGGSTRAIMYYSPASLWQQTSHTLEDKVWSFVTISSNGNSFDIYVNGIYLSTQNYAVTINLQRLCGAHNTPEDYFNGILDEVTLWNRTLTTEEILVEYNRMVYPIAEYHLDENTGDIAYDSSGNNNNGTLHNASWIDAGVNNSALSFNGVDDYVRTQFSDNLDITDVISMEAWVKPEELLWKYKRPIYLYPPSPKENYQVKVELDTSYFDYSKAKSDGADIRFYDENGSKLHYWLETWTVGAKSKFWVNVTTVGTRTIYMYYGNSSASSESNGTAVFEFFDDFNDGVWSDKWKDPNPTGGYTESGGVLKLQSTWYSNLSSKKTFKGPVIIETRSRRLTGNDYYTELREVGTDNIAYYGIGNWGNYFFIRRSGTDFGNQQVDLDSSTNSWNEIRGFLYDTTWHVYRGDTLDDWDRNDKITLGASTNNRTFYVYIFTHEAGDTGAEWDWLWVRKFAEIEPSIFLGDETTLGIAKGGSYGISANTDTAFATINDQTISGTISTGWNHIVQTYDGWKQKLYVNGELETEKDLSGKISTNTNSLFIGDLFNGTIDEISIWNRVLTPTEIKSQFEKFFPGNTLPYKIILESPANNTFLGTTTPEFSWQMGSDVDADPITYFIQVTKFGNDWSSLVDSEFGIDSLNWTISTQLSDGEYQWRVCAFDGTGTGSWSDVWDFYIDAQAPVSMVLSPSNKQFYRYLNNISGIASDETGAGVNKTEILIKRGEETPQFWDGTDWGMNEHWLSVNGTTKWWFNSSAIDWWNGILYTINSRATDNVTNIETPGEGIEFIIDTSPPSSEIKSPNKYSYLNQLANISGIAIDELNVTYNYSVSGVQYVLVNINRTTDGKSWNGVAWDSQEVWLLATGTNMWSMDTSRVEFTTDTNYTIRSFAWDYLENQELPGAGVTFMYDDQPPVNLSIVINAGEEYTNSSNVTLSLDADDTGSGLAQVSYSDDGTTWPGWENFNSTREYNLSGEDGNKFVFYRARDRAGNIAVSVFEEIILDTTPPKELTVLIDNGATKTNSTLVTLSINAIDEYSGVSQMSFSTDETNWTAWEPFSKEKTFMISPDDGVKTIYFRVMDNLGNIANPIVATIILDTTIPKQDGTSDGEGDEDPSRKSNISPIIWFILIIVIIIIIAIIVIAFVLFKKTRTEQQLLQTEAVTVKPSGSTVITIDDTPAQPIDTHFPGEPGPIVSQQLPITATSAPFVTSTPPITQAPGMQQMPQVAPQPQLPAPGLEQPLTHEYTTEQMPFDDTMVASTEYAPGYAPEYAPDYTPEYTPEYPPDSAPMPPDEPELEPELMLPDTFAMAPGRESVEPSPGLGPEPTLPSDIPGETYDQPTQDIPETSTTKQKDESATTAPQMVQSQGYLPPAQAPEQETTTPETEPEQTEQQMTTPELDESEDKQTKKPDSDDKNL